ncbi:hypothetical protein J3R83DRAFT_2193 [Lanmaoa asiatica]|nr:hypothetical protein J3R83DRAFT_2193 [Lanmaoa asiatica]
MTCALTATLARLYAEGAIAGVISAGDSGDTSVCAAAFRDAFPIGFLKFLVSTMASGTISHYVGETDMTMMYSVVDIAGMNALLHKVFGNAASAIAGMTLRPRLVLKDLHGQLEELGYSGGLSLERLIPEGYFVGVLDLTTTELADELVGGVLSAGPEPSRGSSGQVHSPSGLSGRAGHGQLWPSLDRSCKVFW